jgi:hypothetical protein
MDVTELAMLLESVDAVPASHEEFVEATENVKKFKLEDDQKLQIYGLFKQSTVRVHTFSGISRDRCCV